MGSSERDSQQASAIEDCTSENLALKKKYHSPGLSRYGAVKTVTGSNMGASAFDATFNDNTGVLMMAMM